MDETRLKILDGNRKGVLQLPSGAVHLWFAYYMCESEGREAYPSVRTLAKLTNLDPKTVNKWQRYLLENGWLVRVGGHASDRYTKATQGSHRTPILRVDDPTKGVGNIPTASEGVSPKLKELEWGVGDIPTGVGNYLVGNIPTKVSGSVSGSYSGSGSDSSSVRTMAKSSLACEQDDATHPSPTGIETTPTPEPKAKPTPKTPASPVEVKRKHLPKYTEPFPVDFNSWTNLARLEWTEKHKVPVESKSVALPVLAEKSSVPVESKEKVPVELKRQGLSPVTTPKVSAPVEKQAPATPIRPPNPLPPPFCVPVPPAKPKPVVDEPVRPVEGVDYEVNVVEGVSKVTGAYRHECWLCLHCKKTNMEAGNVRHLNAWHKLEGKVWVSAGA